MLDTSRWSVLCKLTRVSFVFPVLMFLDSCSPEVRDVWLAGIQTAAVGVVTALTGLLTTAVQALITGIGQDDGGGVTTVQAVFEWAERAIC